MVSKSKGHNGNFYVRSDGKIIAGFKDEGMADIFIDALSGKLEDNIIETLNKTHKYGYTATISETNVFVIAKNISEAMDKLEVLSNGSWFELTSHSSFSIVNT